MKTCAIVGINWGDEGKGRMVDLLTESYDIVIRYQGGGNAGHTVVNRYGKFALHLLPSGIFHPNVVNVLGNGVALDPENLWVEIEDVRSLRKHALRPGAEKGFVQPSFRSEQTAPGEERIPLVPKQSHEKSDVKELKRRFTAMAAIKVFAWAFSIISAITIQSAAEIMADKAMPAATEPVATVNA